MVGFRHCFYLYLGCVVLIQIGVVRFGLVGSAWLGWAWLDKKSQRLTMNSWQGKVSRWSATTPKEATNLNV
jgi:hypothetical protein